MLMLMLGSADSSEKLGLLFKRYSNVLLKYAFDILKSRVEAEDCVSDVFLKVSQILADTPEKIGAVEERKTGNFLITITKNRALNMLRHNNVLQLTGLRDSDVDTAHFSNPVEYEVLNIKETRRIMKDTLSNMDEKYRMPMILYYYHSFSIPDIAKILDLKENHVSVLLMRGRKMVRKVLLQHAE